MLRVIDMRKEREQTRKELLDIIESYVQMIKRDNNTYPTVVLNDICVSAEYVLKRNGR